MKIALIRHGQIQKPSGRYYIGQTDYSLSEAGRAEMLLLKEQGIPMTSILYSSSSLRCIQSAELIADKKIPVEVISGLQEINLGCWEGKSFQEIKLNEPVEFEKRGETLFTYKTPGGESFKEVQERGICIIKHLLEESNEKLPLVLVTHKGMIRSLLCKIYQKPLEELFQYEILTGSITYLNQEQTRKLIT